MFIVNHALKTLKLLKTPLAGFLSRAYSRSLKENNQATVFKLDIKGFTKEELSTVSASFEAYFGGDAAVELHLIDASTTTQKNSLPNEIWLDPSDFENVTDNDLWQVFTLKLQKASRGLTFYENPTAIAHYNLVDQIKSDSFTNLVVDDFIFTKWMESKGHRKILDAGCGAGAFYFLLTKTLKEFKYTGFDYSKGQIVNAKMRHPDIDFFVGDLGQIKADKFGEYDAVHAWSVFAFMRKSDALRGLEQILISDCETFLTISCTEKSDGFVPELRYVAREEDVTGGKQNVMVDYFPDVQDVKEIVHRSGKYTIQINEEEYGPHWLTTVVKSGSNLQATALTRIIGFLGGKLSVQKKYLKVRIYPKSDEKLMQNLLGKYTDNFSEEDFKAVLER